MSLHAGVRAVLAFVALSATVAFTDVAQDHDYSRTRLSEAKRYRGTIVLDGDSIPQRRMLQWTLHLETPEGVAVDSADVAIDGGMPKHGHGLPTSPRVTRRLGHGDYVVEGIKFSMPGWWVMRFRVTSSVGRDLLTFNFKL